MAVFAIPVAIYLLGAVLLAFRFESFNGDAQARLANAYYMLFSRDPHLAAIGFVWNPLPSFLDLPLLIFKPMWTPLATRAFAGNIVSALCMAGSVAALCGTLRDAGTARSTRLVITCLYAANPMIFYYGANGMSEGLFLLTLTVTCRYLQRWLASEELRSLIIAGAALGVAYLARNEAAFAAAFAGLLVAAVSWRRAKGDWKNRLMSAATDGTIFGAPFAVSFMGWAVTSWIIVGNPLEQFTSIYGTTSQLQVMNRMALGASAPSAISILVRELFALGPLFVLVVGATIIAAGRRRDKRVFAPLSVLGGVLMFAILADLAGQTAGWFRYYITEVPLVALLVGMLLTRGNGANRRISNHSRDVLFGVAAFVLIAPGLFTSWSAMRDSSVGREETLHLNYVFARATALKPEQVADARRWRDASGITTDLDKRHLGHGAILVDNFTACIPYILLDSRNPEQFVIPNDRDYQRVLADPATFHADYFLVPNLAGFGALDAVNRSYPTMFTNGAGVADFVTQYTSVGCPPLRLYHLRAQGNDALAHSTTPAPRGR